MVMFELDYYNAIPCNRVFKFECDKETCEWTGGFMKEFHENLCRQHSNTDVTWINRLLGEDSH